MTDANIDTPARKRASPRVVIDKRVEWDGRSELTRDISGGGLFVRTTEPLPVGIQLALRLALHDDDSPLPVTATVLRNQTAPNAGAALRFCEDQPAARAEIGSFLLSLLAQDEPSMDETIEVVTVEEPHLVDWQQTLEERERQLTLAVAAMHRVRDAQHARKEADQERAEALDRREQLLRAADEHIKCNRLALEKRHKELDLRSAKLVELARTLEVEQQGLGQRATGLDDRAEVLEATARQLEETQRQLQVHAFERNLLTEQLREARSARATLTEKLELAEIQQKSELQQKGASREENTQRFVMPEEQIPADRRPSVQNIPTAEHPRSASGRMQAGARSARSWLRDFLTNPGE